MGSVPASGLVHRPLRDVSSNLPHHAEANTAKRFRELAKRHQGSKFGVYITGDGSDVYEDSFMNVAKSDGNTFRPTLILVGTLLGIGKINPAYWEALSSSLQMPQSIGIAGGVI